MSAATLNVPLVPPGTDFADRVNQVDLSLAKWFQVGTTRVQGQFDMFNAFNRSAVLSVRSLNFGTASYNQPSSVLQGRILRLGMQLKW